MRENTSSRNNRPPSFTNLFLVAIRRQSSSMTGWPTENGCQTNKAPNKRRMTKKKSCRGRTREQDHRGSPRRTGGATSGASWRRHHGQPTLQKPISGDRLLHLPIASGDTRELHMVLLPVPMAHCGGCPWPGRLPANNELASAPQGVPLAVAHRRPARSLASAPLRCLLIQVAMHGSTLKCPQLPLHVQRPGSFSDLRRAQKSRWEERCLHLRDVEHREGRGGKEGEEGAALNLV